MSEFNSTIQAPPGAARISTSGVIGWAKVWSKAKAGLGIERADLGDHLGQVFGIHTADAHQPLQVAPSQQFEVIEQRLHRRIEPVAVAQLQRQAFGQAAREDAGRIESLQSGQHRFDSRQRCAQDLGDLVQIGRQIAGLVHRLDQMQADQPVDRIGQVHIELAG